MSIKEVIMNEHTLTKPEKSSRAGKASDPVHVIRRGAVAASIWQRQSPAGYSYYDFSLSRSWKSLSSDKMGYSQNFFDSNQSELSEVIQQASAWIVERKQQDGSPVITI